MYDRKKFRSAQNVTDVSFFVVLFSDESTILEEVPIDYVNKVAIYDDYCDETYAIKSSDD